MNSMMTVDDSSRRSSFSIFIEDVDSKKDTLSRNDEREREQKNKEERSQQQRRDMNEFLRVDCTEAQVEGENKENTWQASNEAIKQIMAEMERRKHEFCKLIDEHDALIKHLKAMETKHSNFKMAQQSPIMI